MNQNWIQNWKTSSLFLIVLVWSSSYSCYHRYNYRSYLSIYTAQVKRNHSVNMVLPSVERLRNWPLARFYNCLPWINWCLKANFNLQNSNYRHNIKNVSNIFLFLTFFTFLFCNTHLCIHILNFCHFFRVLNLYY